MLPGHEWTPPHENLSLIVAVSENGVIGRENELPWRLAADLRRFKQLTMGHSIIMGRRTFESVGRLLPGRLTIILSRNRQLSVPGANVVHDWNAIWQATKNDSEPFVVGGAEIYRQALDFCRTVYLTRVMTCIDGDASFEWNPAAWSCESLEAHRRDERNEFDYTFEIYRRKHPTVTTN